MAGMTLDEFQRRLEEVVPRGSDLRPFTCEGSPLVCKIFLVGFNPATELSATFWEFWRPGYGFDKAAWLACYKRERLAAPLKPGKKKRLEVSPTRRRIECFVEGANPVPVLETNIFSAASADMRSLDPARREIAPFEFLMRTIEPEVVLAHGKDAIEAVRSLGVTALLLEAGHFSRFETKASAREWGRRAARR